MVGPQAKFKNLLLLIFKGVTDLSCVGQPVKGFGSSFCEWRAMCFEKMTCQWVW